MKIDVLYYAGRALEELAGAINGGYYTRRDLEYLNYSEICEWCDWPDLQNDGIYEQAIDLAAKIALQFIEQA